MNQYEVPKSIYYKLSHLMEHNLEKKLFARFCLYLKEIAGTQKKTHSKCDILASWRPSLLNMCDLMLACGATTEHGSLE